jgi:uncharacterized protein YdiU (UPF0061 family)
MNKNKLDQLDFSNPFAKLSAEFYNKQDWSSLPKAKLVSFNKDLANELGLEKIDPDDLVQIFNGEVKNF